MILRKSSIPLLRWSLAGLLLMGAGAIVKQVLAADATNPAPPAEPIPAIGEPFGKEESKLLIREGTRVTDTVGRFKLAGDRVMFYFAKTEQKIGTLENLSLERIARTVSESPDILEWDVEGVITEFRGSNYLMVTHAVVKNRTGKQ